MAGSDSQPHKGERRGFPKVFGEQPYTSLHLTDLITLEKWVQQTLSLKTPWTLEMTHHRLLSGAEGELRVAICQDIAGLKALERLFWDPPLGEALLIFEPPPYSPQFRMKSSLFPSFLQHARRLRNWLRENQLTPGTLLRFSPDVDTFLLMDHPELEGFYHMIRDLQRWEWHLVEVLNLFQELDSTILYAWFPDWQAMGILVDPPPFTPPPQKPEEVPR
jgi:hypothetical protein